MYDPNKLWAMTFANGLTLWNYKTPDEAHVVYAPNYFALASHMLRAGDKVIVNADIHGRLTAFDLYVVDVIKGEKPYVETAVASQVCASCLTRAEKVEAA